MDDWKLSAVTVVKLEKELTMLVSRVCTVVQYAVLEAIRAVYGKWQI